MNLLRSPLVLLLATLLLGWAVFGALAPPQPLGVGVSDSIFSAGKAELLLKELYQDDQAHVSGSRQNTALRDRILVILDRFDYSVEIQSLFHCRPEIGRCSPVDNILAVRKGTTSGSTIMLTAHYDSSWAGPGVADDGAGVAAVLEIARMAKLQPEFDHELIFLLTDAEEQGLLGADAFVTQHPLFASVRSVINLEARGASGASTMFETGDGNRGIIRMLAKNLDRPVANSVAYEIYRRMPNDTDFSVYRKDGVTGVNFAFTRGAPAYHASIDDLSHLDLGSLQHHGQNAWSMLLALDERNLDRLPSKEDSVYIDLFGRKLLQYPVSSSLGLALVLSVLVVVAIRRTFPRLVFVRQVLWTTLAVLLLLLLLPASGWLLSWPLGRWVDVHPLEHPFPWLGRSTLFLTAVWLISRVLRFLRQHSAPEAVMATCWSIYALLSVVLAYALPVAGYLATLPLLGFALGLLLDAFRWHKKPRLLFANLSGFLAAAYIGFYFFFQLDVVLNFDQSAIKMIPLLLPAIAVLPTLSGYFAGRVAKPAYEHVLLALALIGCVGQHFVPGYTPGSPRDMALMVRQDIGQSKALLVLESVLAQPDPVFAQKHEFFPVSLPVFDGSERQVLAREIALLELPEITEIQRIVEESKDTPGLQNHVLELELPEGLQQLVFSFTQGSGLNRALINGQLAFDPNLASAKSANNRRLVINHPQPGPVRFEFQLPGGLINTAQMIARFAMPKEILETYRQDWPEDAQAAFLGPRVLQYSVITFGGEE